MRKILAPLAAAVLATTTFAATANADTATGGPARSALDGSGQSGEFPPVLQQRPRRLVHRLRACRNRAKTYNENASFQWIA